MEKLEHPLWIVDAVNALLGPLVVAAGNAVGYHFTGHHPIPNYMVMTLLIVAGVTTLGLLLRSRLSVENPGRVQIVLEDLVRSLQGLLRHSVEDSLINWAWEPGGRRESVPMPQTVFTDFFEEWVRTGAHCPK